MMTEEAGAPSVLLLVASNRRRGAEVFGETLAEGLRTAGWSVGFAALSASREGPTVSATPLSTQAPDALSRLDRSVVAQLAEEVRDTEPDILLANGASTMQYSVAAVRWWRRRPKLVYVSIGEPMWWIRNERHRWLRTAILKAVDRVFSVSSTTAQQLIEQLGVPKTKLRIAPTGVPDRFFATPGPRRRGPVNATAPLRVIFVGNLSAEKGPLASVEVLRRLSAAHPVHARFLGNGPLRSDVEQAAADQQAEIELLGSVADVVPHLEWADVLLMTSQTEGLPGVPLEAGAAAVPSVVFDVGGSRETVLDGTTGYVVAPGDVDAAVAALTAFAEDPMLVTAMGAAARTHVRRNFMLAESVQRYIDLLADELPRGR